MNTCPPVSMLPRGWELASKPYFTRQWMSDLIVFLILREISFHLTTKNYFVFKSNAKKLGTSNWYFQLRMISLNEKEAPANAGYDDPAIRPKMHQYNGINTWDNPSETLFNIISHQSATSWVPWHQCHEGYSARGLENCVSVPFERVKDHLRK